MFFRTYLIVLCFLDNRFSISFRNLKQFWFGKTGLLIKHATFEHYNRFINCFFLLTVSRWQTASTAHLFVVPRNWHFSLAPLKVHLKQFFVCSTRNFFKEKLRCSSQHKVYSFNRIVWIPYGRMNPAKIWLNYLLSLTPMWHYMILSIFPGRWLSIV